MSVFADWKFKPGDVVEWADSIGGGEKTIIQRRIVEQEEEYEADGGRVYSRVYLEDCHRLVGLATPPTYVGHFHGPMGTLEKTIALPHYYDTYYVPFVQARPFIGEVDGFPEMNVRKVRYLNVGHMTPSSMYGAYDFKFVYDGEE